MNAQHQPPGAAWPAVFSMMLGVFSLVTSEFLPSSLLTPMAADLHTTEGVAGQAVAVTAAIALLVSLLVSTVTRRLDRRRVFLAFSSLMIASNLLVIMAPNVSMLLAARILLGIAIGGFWAMSTATVMRLVPEPDIPRALSLVFSGVAAATIVAAPVGSYLGAIIGWRLVFLISAALGLLALVVQALTLPRMAPRNITRLVTLVQVMKRPRIGLGILSVGLIFAGHFAFFTYLRPFLENVTGVGIDGVSSILLLFGIANFLGSVAGGRLVARSLSRTLITMPLVLGVLGLGLAGLGGVQWSDATMIAIWGFAFGVIPMSWSTWLTRYVSDEAEAAGGLMVAAIQTGIAAGAAAGGLFVDTYGVPVVFAAGSVILLLGTLTTTRAVSTKATAPYNPVTEFYPLIDTCNQLAVVPSEPVHESR